MRTAGRGGWTVTEFMIVLVVVGLLAAVGAAKYAGMAVSARRLACIENQGVLDRAVRAWEHRHRELPAGSQLTFDQNGRIVAVEGTGAGEKPAEKEIASLAASPDLFICPERLHALGGKAALTESSRAGEKDYTWLHSSTPDARLGNNRSGAFCLHFADTGPDDTPDTRHR
ncbi:MAG: hypothetical protein HYY25_13575 [Candidatus Wallbacteria bacterium]|nr:hypothetical protein [Candidatus Wallbacteria bacterium]